MWSLAVPADIQRGDAVSDDRPSGPHDALSVRTLYFGPDAEQRWEWITPGSLLGSALLICISLLFRVYVQNWGNYSATYGSLGGIVVLMSWLWLCSVVLLTGAEINKVIEDASPLGKPYGQKHEGGATSTADRSDPAPAIRPAPSDAVPSA